MVSINATLNQSREAKATALLGRSEEKAKERG